jgi:predicted RNA-binding Zn-ribbon protein involved in translation (DUF1610 family)
VDKRWQVDGRPIQVCCPFCGLWMDVQTTKKGKPYSLCPTCGLQLFWRLPQGIERLAEAARHPKVTDVRFTSSNEGVDDASLAS